MSTSKLYFFTLWGNFLLYKVYFICIIRSNRRYAICHLLIN
nr:MAG TPA: hypothetical protein [Caudoviricetes sp.]